MVDRQRPPCWRKILTKWDSGLEYSNRNEPITVRALLAVLRTHFLKGDLMSSLKIFDHICRLLASASALLVYYILFRFLLPHFLSSNETGVLNLKQGFQQSFFKVIIVRLVLFYCYC